MKKTLFVIFFTVFTLILLNIASAIFVVLGLAPAQNPQQHQARHLTGIYGLESNRNTTNDEIADLLKTQGISFFVTPDSSLLDVSAATPVSSAEFGPPSAPLLTLTSTEKLINSLNILEKIKLYVAAQFSEHFLNSLIREHQLALDAWYRQNATSKTFAVVDASAKGYTALGITKKWWFPEMTNAASFAQIKLNLMHDSSKISAEKIKSELQAGHFIFGFSGLGALNLAEISVITPEGNLPPGSTLPAGQNTKIRIDLQCEYATQIALIKDGVRLRHTTRQSIIWPLSDPGVYLVIINQNRRVFPFLRSRKMPWIFSNPYFVY